MKSRIRMRSHYSTGQRARQWQFCHDPFTRLSCLNLWNREITVHTACTKFQKLCILPTEFMRLVSRKKQISFPLQQTTSLGILIS